VLRNDGKVVLEITAVVSEDNNMLTETRERYRPEGKAEEIFVFVRK
jgi:hypothetical protein